MTEEKNKGITIVILSFERMKGLAALLESILMQDLRDLKYEIIICNNSSQVKLKRSKLTKIGRVLSRVPDLKIFNSSYNWGCQVRYQMATLGKYDTIQFFDDDVMLLDKNFIYDMYTEHKKLEPNDILSAYGIVWTKWQDDYFTKATFFYRELEVKQITPCDTVGAGICMFARDLATKPEILNMWLDYPGNYDWPFSLVAAMKYDSKRYYFPAYKRMNFHDDKVKKPIYQHDNYNKRLSDLYKLFIKKGYKPILSELPKEATEDLHSVLIAKRLTQTKLD